MYFAKLIRFFRDFSDIPKEAKYLVYANGFASVTFSFYFMIFPVFLPMEGIKIPFVGLWMMIMGISSVLSSLVMGPIAQKYGKRRVALLGAYFGVLTFLIYAFTSDPYILFLAAAMGGVEEAMFIATGNALLAEKASDEKRTLAFSYSFFLGNIGFMVGGLLPILMYFISGKIGIDIILTHRIFIFALGLFGLGAPLMIQRLSKDEISAQKKFNYVPRKSMSVFYKYVITGILIAFGAGLIIPLFPTWALLKFHLTDEVSGPVLSVANLFMAIASLVTPYLSNKIGTVKTIVLTQLSSTIFLVAIPLISGFLLVAILYISRTFLMNMSNPAEQSMIMGLVDKDERTTVSALSGILWRLPNSISTGIGALILTSISLSLPFYLCALFYIISISLFFYFFKNVKLK